MATPHSRARKNGGNGHAPPGPDLTPFRQALKAALDQFQSETQRLESLRLARDQARERRFELDQILRAKEQTADEIERGEPGRRAEIFTNQGVISVKPTPELKKAHSELAEAQAESNSIEAIAATITDEIQHCELGLTRLRSAVNEALTRLIIASPEFDSLLQANAKMWEKLRGLRAAGELILRACSGNMPDQLARRIQMVEPLEPGHKMGDHLFDTDYAPVQAWEAAIEALRQDPNAALPEAV